MEILEEIQQKINQSPAAALYITTEECGVCDALKPKLFPMLQTQFPALELLEINTEEHPTVAAYFQVFTVPTLLIFFEGKETLRKSRAFSLAELQTQLARPYDLMFA